MSEEHDATSSLVGSNSELEELRARVVEQAATIEQLREYIQQLEARLAKDSHNSSKPPSSDPPFKKPPPRSQRKPSTRKPGGQKGRRGVTRDLSEDPDECVIIPLMGTCDCGRCCADIAAEVLAERRQVVEVQIRSKTTEYRIVGGTCTCGRVHHSAFPEEVKAPVQYGPGVSAFAVYMTQYQLLPYQRTAEVLSELAGIGISPGTIHRAVTVAAAHLEKPVAAIRGALIEAPVAHADETGMRVAGGLYWLHVLSTAWLTAYFPHPKRGAEALEAFGLLRQFLGVLVHDHWSAYERYQCLHAFCNAHHLRELIAIAETIPSQTWAGDMITLLCEANTLTCEARAQGLEALPAPEIERLQGRYDSILSAGEARNPRRPRRAGARGRAKQSPAYNLIARLRDHRDEVLRFITDLRVPFDNNLAERDIRMPKLKQKVSGCFRSEAGVDAFAIIRSYLSTLRKQSANIYESLIQTFEGSPPMPRLG